MTFGPPGGNAFQAVMVSLEVPSGRPLDIFSESLLVAIAECNWRGFGFPFTQVFEPAVLREIALLERVELRALTMFEHKPTATTRLLCDAIGGKAELSVPELINAASILVCVSRFAPASDLVEAAVRRSSSVREDFEIAWLQFVISNRVDDGAGSVEAFGRMRHAVEAGGVPPARALDACTQAVVWYVKRQEISVSLFRWFAQHGTALAAGGSDDLTSGGLSAWYRGIAMVPAAAGRHASTRRYMAKALAAAELAERARPGADARNARKTYYESTMKECLYVTGDLDAARDAGLALLDLDPYWSLSVGELAEVHERRREPERAAELYEQAVELGPPSVGHHLRRAARCRAAQGRHDLAQMHYRSLLSLAPGDPVIEREAVEAGVAVHGTDLVNAASDRPVSDGGSIA